MNRSETLDKAKACVCGQREYAACGAEINSKTN